jgi:hypothetical protein
MDTLGETGENRVQVSKTALFPSQCFILEQDLQVPWEHPNSTLQRPPSF